MPLCWTRNEWVTSSRATCGEHLRTLWLHCSGQLVVQLVHSEGSQDLWNTMCPPYPQAQHLQIGASAEWNMPQSASKGPWMWPEVTSNLQWSFQAMFGSCSEKQQGGWSLSPFQYPGKEGNHEPTLGMKEVSSIKWLCDVRACALPSSSFLPR